MQSPFEIQSVQVGGDRYRCLVWHDPAYHMFRGGIIHQGHICLLMLLDCHTYSSTFHARPELAGLSFPIVRDLFDLLVSTDWQTFISDHDDREMVERMISQLLQLRRHWISKDLNSDWTARTADQADLYAAASLRAD